jgi:hypothetical protein
MSSVSEVSEVSPKSKITESNAQKSCRDEVSDPYREPGIISSFSGNSTPRNDGC